MPSANRQSLIAFCLALALSACGPAAPPEPSPTLYIMPPAPTLVMPIAPPTATVTPTPLPSATPTLTATAIATETPTISTTADYAPMLDEVSTYIAAKQQQMPQLVIGFAFVDIASGQTLELNGTVPHYALSAFKSALGAYYYWLIEQGQLTAQSGDPEIMYNMLNWSSNPDTTCMIKRVGGLKAFNNWLADQGFSRNNNFVFRWQAWGCSENGTFYLPEDDSRYAFGDDALGIPANYTAMLCVPHFYCDKELVPLELAEFYARIYRGEVLNPTDTGLWMENMIKKRDGSPFYQLLPEDGRIHVYSKDGFLAADDRIAMNFFNEAGIIETPQGSFAISVFMRGNPSFPGDSVIGDIAGIAYNAFVAAHP